MPVLGREHVRGRGPVLGHLGLGGEEDPRLDVAALGVHGVELGGDRLRARSASSVSSSSSPASARCRRPAALIRGASRKPIASRRRARDPLAQPPSAPAGPACACSPARAAPRARAGGSRPWSGTTSATVASATRSRSSSAAAGSSPAASSSAWASLCATPVAQRSSARVPAHARVHDRSVGQPAVGARGVMVGHHDVEPRRARGGDLLDGGDRAVDGDEQVGPALGQPPHGRLGEAVAVVDPARQVPVDVRAERAQRAHEHGRGGHAVDVVVAVHGDPGPAPDVREDPPRGVPQPAEGVERMAVGAARKRFARPPGRRGRGAPAPARARARPRARPRGARRRRTSYGATVKRVWIARHGRRSVRRPSDGTGMAQRLSGVSGMDRERRSGGWRAEKRAVASKWIQHVDAACRRPTTHRRARLAGRPVDLDRLVVRGIDDAQAAISTIVAVAAPAGRRSPPWPLRPRAEDAGPELRSSPRPARSTLRSTRRPPTKAPADRAGRAELARQRACGRLRAAGAEQLDQLDRRLLAGSTRVRRGSRRVRDGLRARDES